MYGKRFKRCFATTASRDSLLPAKKTRMPLRCTYPLRSGILQVLSAFRLLGVFSDILDFSCSLHHVINAGRIVVGNASPPPSFFKFPVGYQGRTSSIVVSGTDIERPYGHFRNPKCTDPQSEEAIIFGPSQKVDYEVELAAVIGEPLPMKKRLHADDADNHIFGFVILKTGAVSVQAQKGF